MVFLPELFVAVIIGSPQIHIASSNTVRRAVSETE